MCGILLILFVCLVLFDNKVVDDEVLAFHCVLAHVVGEQILDLVVLVQLNALQTHVGAYEVAELVGRNLTKSLESCNLGVG